MIYNYIFIDYWDMFKECIYYYYCYYKDFNSDVIEVMYVYVYMYEYDDEMIC